jgi:hypothetical protein
MWLESQSRYRTTRHARTRHTRCAVEGDAHSGKWSQLVAVSGRNPDLGSDDGLVCGKLALALGLLLPGHHKSVIGAISTTRHTPHDTRRTHNTHTTHTTTTAAAYLDL